MFKNWQCNILHTPVGVMRDGLGFVEPGKIIGQTHLEITVFMVFAKRNRIIKNDVKEKNVNEKIGNNHNRSLRIRI